MILDYTSLIHAAEDGRIWWRLEDAIKLGAGYLPVRDDERNLVAVLHPQNNRARVNERTLLSAFHDPRLVILRPRILKRDDGCFVEARGFLVWLHRYLDQAETAIEFPDEIARALTDPLCASVEGSVGPRKFVLPTVALEERFDRPLDEMPASLRERVDEVLFPMTWDTLTVDERRGVARQWNFQHDPAADQDRESWWDLVLRKPAIEKQIAQWKAVAAPTGNELAQKEARLADLEKELARIRRQQRDFGIDDAPVGSPASPCQAVSAAEIRRHFRVIRDEDANDAWWKEKMRDAKRCGLAECRVGNGKGGRGGGSLWRPDLVAGWLADAQSKGRNGLSAAAARTALKKFPGCEEVAEDRFPLESE